MARSHNRSTVTQLADEDVTDLPPKPIGRATERATTPSPESLVLELARSARPRPTSKLGIVLGMLEADDGASLARIVEVTGWLPHTARAALSGLRKRGFAVTGEKVREENGEGASIYRVTAAAERG